MLPRVHVEADYRRRCATPTSSSAAPGSPRSAGARELCPEIRRTDGVVCIVGRIVAAAVDLAGRSTPPPEFREALARGT
jgi:hypothetical protein